jgi:hypothetical protein
MNLFEINALGVKFAAARIKLKAILDIIRDGQREVMEEQRGALRAAANAANTRQADLAGAIRAHPELFTKPRSVVVDGVRFGMTTAKGKLEWEDADEVVQSIYKRMPALADTLIHLKAAPNKEALAKLTDDQLDKLGITRQPDDPHAVLIKPTDSEVDKLVASLLEDIAPETKDLVA